MDDLKPCQIHCIGQIAKPTSFVDALWQGRNRLLRMIKRRWWYLVNLVAEGWGKEADASERDEQRCKTMPLQPGDRVRVRSEEEIRGTLNHWSQLNGCSFMEEMWPYCGTTQRVFKRVEKFLDERDYIMKKCKGLFILESVFCEGTKDFGKCDRTCFFFWREDWLEKIE